MKHFISKITCHTLFNYIGRVSKSHLAFLLCHPQFLVIFVDSTHSSSSHPLCSTDICTLNFTSPLTWLNLTVLVHSSEARGKRSVYYVPKFRYTEGLVVEDRHCLHCTVPCCVRIKACDLMLYLIPHYFVSSRTAPLQKVGLQKSRHCHCRAALKRCSMWTGSERKLSVKKFNRAGFFSFFT